MSAPIPGSGTTGDLPAAPRPGELSTGDRDLTRAAKALQAGQVQVAEALCRATLRTNPRNVAAMHLLAIVGMGLGRADDAEKLLSLCLELAPDFHPARYTYADLLFRQLRLREALAEIDRALEAQPEQPADLLLKASILSLLSKSAEAVEIYERVLRRDPASARTHVAKGNALRAAGRGADSEAAYRKAIALQPTLGEAYWSLANLKTFRFEAADITSMRDLVASGTSSEDDFLHLSFALGKALEDAGEFDESFFHYARGNATRRRSVRWDADQHHADIELITGFFGPDFFASRRGCGNPAKAPIFIVGLPRSGSTLLEQILASHSQVQGTMELPDVMAIARRLGGNAAQSRNSLYPDALTRLSRGEFKNLGSEYLERTAIHRSTRPYFIDKQPNNFLHVGLIHLMLPNARIVDARRQGMACCFSIFKQLFASGQHFSYDLRDLGRFYRDYTALMTHWDQVLPDRVHRVDYEALVDDTETTVRRLLDYCGLEFEPACLEFHRTERSVRTPSSEQVRQPIYANAVEHWRNYDAHLAPLAEALGSEAA